MKRAEPVSSRKIRKERNRRRNAFLPLAIGASGGVILATVAFIFFKEQADRVVAGKADAFDTSLMKYVHRYENEAVDQGMIALTQLGSHAVIGASAGITAIMMIRRGRRHDAFFVLMSTGGAMALNTVLKNIFRRQRPKEMSRRIKLPSSHSFPSGHSLLSAATYPIVAHSLVQRRSTRTQTFVMTLTGWTIAMVGFTRIYLGVHFPSDVLGGFAAGLGWLGLTAVSHSFVDSRPSAEIAEHAEMIGEDG
ncbi:MAG TPA: phosphatase PAP2 family protein [Thermoanaerobaculia bacterium]|nr:phosphatase PAP2 family protein [Thermoanaerobaculia bacterium]